MIARLASLRGHPAVSRHLTGLTAPAVDALARDVAPAVDATPRSSLDRPNRRRAIGAGGAPGLTTADHALPTVVWLRQYPTPVCLGLRFGVPDSAAPAGGPPGPRPALERAGRGTMRMPGPGVSRRTDLPALRRDTPGPAVVTDPLEPRAHRPKRRQRAYDAGKTTAHPPKSQVGVDGDAGRVAGVSDSAPGPGADLRRL